MRPDARACDGVSAARPGAVLGKTCQLDPATAPSFGQVLWSAFFCVAMATVRCAGSTAGAHLPLRAAVLSSCQAPTAHGCHGLRAYHAARARARTGLGTSLARMRAGCDSLHPVGRSVETRARSRRAFLSEVLRQAQNDLPDHAKGRHRTHPSVARSALRGAGHRASPRSHPLRRPAACGLRRGLIGRRVQQVPRVSPFRRRCTTTSEVARSTLSLPNPTLAQARGLLAGQFFSYDTRSKCLAAHRAPPSAVTGNPSAERGAEARPVAAMGLFRAEYWPRESAAQTNIPLGEVALRGNSR